MALPGESAFIGAFHSRVRLSGEDFSPVSIFDRGSRQAGHVFVGPADKRTDRQPKKTGPAHAEFFRPFVRARDQIPGQVDIDPFGWIGRFDRHGEVSDGPAALGKADGLESGRLRQGRSASARASTAFAKANSDLCQGILLGRAAGDAIRKIRKPDGKAALGAALQHRRIESLCHGTPTFDV